MNWNEIQSEIRSASSAWARRGSIRIADSREFIVAECAESSFSTLIEEIARIDPSLAFDVGHYLLNERSRGSAADQPWPIQYPSERKLSFTSLRLHDPTAPSPAREIPGLPGHFISYENRAPLGQEADHFVYLFWCSWLSGILAQVATEALAYGEQRIQGGRLIQEWSEHRLRTDLLCSEILSLVLALDQLRSREHHSIAETRALTFRFAHRAETLVSDAMSLFGGAGYMREYPIADRMALITALIPTLRSDRQLMNLSKLNFDRLHSESL